MFPSNIQPIHEWATSHLHTSLFSVAGLKAGEKKHRHDFHTISLNMLPYLASFIVKLLFEIFEGEFKEKKKERWRKREREKNVKRIYWVMKTHEKEGSCAVSSTRRAGVCLAASQPGTSSGWARSPPPHGGSTGWPLNVTTVPWGMKVWSHFWETGSVLERRSWRRSIPFIRIWGRR